MSKGFIYILSNEYMPGLLKIGHTTGSPEERAKQISGRTGVPGTFRVVFQEYVSNSQEAEKYIHRYLSGCRINKEFFRIPAEDAIKTVQRIAAVYRVQEGKQGSRIISPERRRLAEETRRQRLAERARINETNRKRWEGNIDEPG